MATVRVDEVMLGQPMTVSADLPVALLADEFVRTGHHGFPVLNNDGSLLGVVSLEDYRRAISGKQKPAVPLRVRDIATDEVVSVYSDESVDTALRRMAPRDLSRLPVVARENPHRLLGVVRRTDIVRAYELGALRREEARFRAAQTRAVSDVRVQFVKVTIEPNSDAAHRVVAELDLPRAAVLVSIQRGGDLLIPHGNTQLQAGDTVTALCEREWADEFRIRLKGKKSRMIRRSTARAPILWHRSVRRKRPSNLRHPSKGS
jgi:chloride channel protein, CIC family